MLLLVFKSEIRIEKSIRLYMYYKAVGKSGRFMIDLLSVSSIGFGVVLGLHFLGFIKFFVWVVFVDCIGVGLAIATIMW